MYGLYHVGIWLCLRIGYNVHKTHYTYYIYYYGIL